jgi:hypothetical protein
MKIFRYLLEFGFFVLIGYGLWKLKDWFQNRSGKSGDPNNPDS